MDYLKRPLTITEIKERLEKNSTYISGIVAINLNEIIDNNNTYFMNILCDKLTGDSGSSISDITYEVVGVAEDKIRILINVRGNAFDIINKNENIK